MVTDMSRQFPFTLCSGSNRELNPSSMRGGQESAPQVTENHTSDGHLTRDRGLTRTEAHLTEVILSLDSAIKSQRLSLECAHHCN